MKLDYKKKIYFKNKNEKNIDISVDVTNHSHSERRYNFISLWKIKEIGKKNGI